MTFKLRSPYKPTGDQPQAIELLSNGLRQNIKHQTLLGVTGSGKTFTMANVIEKAGLPTLVMSHNKTLASQLFSELKQFFPENNVEYFVSYYDYYQPESYIPSSDVYIEKDLSINSEIEKYRLSATASLASGRKDVIVVSSVSCIYGIGNPEAFGNSVLQIKTGDSFSQKQFLFTLVDLLYKRTTKSFERGSFRVKGDTVEVYLSNKDFAYRICFWGDEIEKIVIVDPILGTKISEEQEAYIFPANLFIASKELVEEAIQEIQEDLVHQIQLFDKESRLEEAKRIQERTELDLEMLRELGYCSGIENYSRYFDKRSSGERPYCLIDYFPKEFLTVIDECHQSLPQVRAMCGGDRKRKQNLVEYGFRLPSALDNRPLDFGEFEKILDKVIYVSATPSEYELIKSEGVIVEQLIRPTGLLDPEIIIKPSQNQIDDLISQTEETIEEGGRVLITTLTKRLAEELNEYMIKADIRCTYIHSDIKTLERVDILSGLREGTYDVLIGVNLLREGLDLPEVSLVGILDADKEGFLRDTKSLIQTIGRAARNKNGRVIMYADHLTKSMNLAIEETERRRKLQKEYNAKHNITPRSIHELRAKAGSPKKMYLEQKDTQDLAAEPSSKYLGTQDVPGTIKVLMRKMEEAAHNEDYLEAARYRDIIKKLQGEHKDPI